MTQPSTRTGHIQSEELNLFVDGELSPVDTREVQQHIATCSDCALRVASAMQLKSATARSGNRFAPSADVLARLSAQLKPEVEATLPAPVVVMPRKTWFPRYAAWSALAASLVLGLSLLGWQQVHQTNTLSTELLDQHLAVLSTSAVPQVISEDRHTVKPWFQGKLPFSFNLPEPTALPPDTILRGADLVYIQGQPAAQLLFTIHKHQVSVFVTQRTSGFSLTPNSTRSGFNVRFATAAEVRLTGVSDVNPAELQALMQELAKVQ